MFSELADDGRADEAAGADDEDDLAVPPVLLAALFNLFRHAFPNPGPRSGMSCRAKLV